MRQLEPSVARPRNADMCRPWVLGMHREHERVAGKEDAPSLVGSEFHPEAKEGPGSSSAAPGSPKLGPRLRTPLGRFHCRPNDQRIGIAMVDRLVLDDRSIGSNCPIHRALPLGPYVNHPL